jgi:hypothetical protein
LQRGDRNQRPCSARAAVRLCRVHRPSDGGAGVFGAGAHTDWGCLTILATDSSPGALIAIAWSSASEAAHCSHAKHPDQTLRACSGQLQQSSPTSSQACRFTRTIAGRTCRPFQTPLSSTWVNIAVARSACPLAGCRSAYSPNDGGSFVDRCCNPAQVTCWSDGRTEGQQGSLFEAFMLSRGRGTRALDMAAACADAR